LTFSWSGLLVPAAYAQDLEACGESNLPESPTFEQGLKKLASPDADDALI
jgi:hypothetical protein